MEHRAIRQHPGTAILSVLAVLTLVTITGCGSSDSTSSGATTPGPAATTEEASGATTPVAGGETTGADIAVPVTDASYAKGRVHVEFGGDSGGAVEIDGEGTVIGGFANIVFSDTNSQASVIIGVGGDQPGAVAFMWDGITSGGEFGKECTITFSKGDQTTLEGEFSCKGMSGVKATSTDAQHVDAHGTFTLTAGP